jgi:hypothetical protein
MSKRLLQIALIAITFAFAIEEGQRTGWSLKVFAGTLIALAVIILNFVVKDYWIVHRSTRRTPGAA